MTIKKPLLQLEPNSIKDRIVCAVHSIGAAATRPNIRKSVSCDGMILEVAIDALERDGYIHVTPEGNYEIDAELTASYLFKSEPSEPSSTRHQVALPAIRMGKTASLNDVFDQMIAEGQFVASAVDGKLISRQTEEAMRKPESNLHRRHSSGGAVAGTEAPAIVTPIKKKCVGEYSCGVIKPVADFYQDCSNCKRCVLDRQKMLKNEKKKGSVKAKQAVRAKPVAPQKSNTKDKAIELELVVPASGEVSVRAEMATEVIFLEQSDDTVICSFEQFRRIVVWGNRFFSATSIKAKKP